MPIAGIIIAYRKLRLLLLMSVITVFFSCKKDDNSPPLSNDIKADALTEVNNLRTQGCTCVTLQLAPVKAVTWNDSLAKAAANHASDMYQKGYFDHISPSGVTPGDWALQQGYIAVELGENIAQNYATVNETIKAWQNSPEHCTVMMDSVYKEVGAARYGKYWVMIFGRR